jgi:hypothetical protein
MSAKERRDFHTRFKKGQSGNPNGRPKGRKNEATLIRDVLFKTIRVKDGDGVRSRPKIVVATEVLLNKALTGDYRAFVKIMEIAEKFGLFQEASLVPDITCIREIIIDPKDPMRTEEGPD